MADVVGDDALQLRPRPLADGVDNTESEPDDVAVGSEPGACRVSMLVPTDSYEDIAKLIGNCRHTDTNASIWKSEGAIERLRTDTIVHSEVADVNSDSDQQKPKNKISALKVPEPIFARVDTPTSLSEEDNDPRGSNSVDNADQRTSSAVFGLNVSSQSCDAAADVADWNSSEWRMHKRHVFILSFAGKPIYSRHGDEDKQATLMGAMHALVSFVQHAASERHATDMLRSISAGSHRFVFLTREHLILVAASSSQSSTHTLILALTYTYNLIISILTYRRMESIFSTRKNYDLRRLLGGVDRFLDCLLDCVESDPCYYLGAVRCLPLESAVRDLIAQSIAQNVKIKDMVFALLITNGQLITLVRLKKCFLHPVDLHMIFNLIMASECFKHAESWTPICLPKFDSSGYLHAHISYLDENCQTCLLLLTVDKDIFFKLSQCKEKIQEKLMRYGCCKAIKDSLERGNYRMSDVGIPEIWHFLYKSRSTSQLTSPDYGAPYSVVEERNRLFAVYQWIHNRMHSTSRSLKILYYVGKYESILGWITSGFELYATFSPLISKPLAIACVNRLLRWIKKEEDRLFIMNSLTI